MQYIPIKIFVKRQVKYGEGIYIVGSVRELGFWEPSRAVKLFWQENDNWAQTVTISVKNFPVTVEYKLLVMNHDVIDPASASWDSGPNKVIIFQGDSIQPVLQIASLSGKISRAEDTSYELLLDRTISNIENTINEESEAFLGTGSTVPNFESLNLGEEETKRSPCLLFELINSLEPSNNFLDEAAASSIPINEEYTLASIHEASLDSLHTQDLKQQSRRASGKFEVPRVKKNNIFSIFSQDKEDNKQVEKHHNCLLNMIPSYPNNEIFYYKETKSISTTSYCTHIENSPQPKSVGMASYSSQNNHQEATSPTLTSSDFPQTQQMKSIDQSSSLETVQLPSLMPTLSGNLGTIGNFSIGNSNFYKGTKLRKGTRKMSLNEFTEVTVGLLDSEVSSSTEQAVQKLELLNQGNADVTFMSGVSKEIYREAGRALNKSMGYANEQDGLGLTCIYYNFRVFEALDGNTKSIFGKTILKKTNFLTWVLLKYQSTGKLLLAICADFTELSACKTVLGLDMIRGIIEKVKTEHSGLRDTLLSAHCSNNATFQDFAVLRGLVPISQTQKVSKLKLYCEGDLLVKDMPYQPSRLVS